MELNFENIETICRICLQCKQSNNLQHEISNEMFEFSSIYSSVTIDSRTVALIDIITMCLSHKVTTWVKQREGFSEEKILKFQLSEDKDISQMVCSLCVRRLSDCCELKFQIEQSEQLLLSVVSNRLFMGLPNEYTENCDQQLGKSISIIHSVVNDFESLNSASEIVEEKLQKAKETNDLAVPAKRSNKSTSNCTICFKKFSAPTKLDRHLTSQHLVRNDFNVYKPHQCDDCPKSYTTKANLVLHRAVHSGIKTFTCEICGRGFYKKTSLSSHMSIHTGIRKHLCTLCGRSFTSANILQQHKRTHSDVRRFICSVCSKGFHTSNGREIVLCCRSMTRDIKISKNLIADLRVHFRSHSGEKPFLCAHCGRRFSRVTHLNIHLSMTSSFDQFLVVAKFCYHSRNA